jgi:hypothetical protein
VTRALTLHHGPGADKHPAADSIPPPDGTSQHVQAR